MFVTIDPGISTGWALWLGDALIACGVGDPRACSLHVVKSPHMSVNVVDDVWIESQVIYPRSKVPPNDIVKLAHDAGRWAGRYDVLGVAVHWVEPARWKGQVPKDIHHARVWAELDNDEKDRVNLSLKGVAPSKRHNALDAIGLGCWVRKTGGGL